MDKAAEERKLKFDLVREWFYTHFQSGSFAVWIAQQKKLDESATSCVERVYAAIESGMLR